MSYYNYYPFWYGFFNALGIEIKLSSPTTKKTITDGAGLVVTETCLPIKVYVGHVLNLIEKGVKNIFVPSIQSIAPKIYNCSKIRGLPDLIRNVVKGDFNIIEATLDKSEKNNDLDDFLSEIASQFDIKDEKLIKEARNNGFVVQNNFYVKEAYFGGGISGFLYSLVNYLLIFIDLFFFFPHWKDSPLFQC